MSFLGGIDLGTPGDRNRIALTRELESRRSKWTRPTRYRGGADLVLRHGVFAPGRELPAEYEDVAGLSGMTCYLDALFAAEEEPSLRYCEGYAAIGRGSFISHAWCLDATDQVVEVRYPTDEYMMGTTSLPTVAVLRPDHWGYYGITLTAELARAIQDTSGLGALDRSDNEIADLRRRGYPEERIGDNNRPLPLLDVPYDPNRKDLP